MQHAKKEDPRRERIRLVNVAEEKIRLNLHHWNPLGKRSSGNISMFVSSNSRTAAHCKHCTRCLSDGVPSANVFSPPPPHFPPAQALPEQWKERGKRFFLSRFWQMHPCLVCIQNLESPTKDRKKGEEKTVSQEFCFCVVSGPDGRGTAVAGMPLSMLI